MIAGVIFIMHRRKNIQNSRHCDLCRTLVLKLILCVRQLLPVETNSSIWTVCGGYWMYYTELECEVRAGDV